MSDPDRITGPLERPETTSERVRSWWDLLTGPWRTDHLTINILHRLNRLELNMAADRDLLTSIAADMTTLAGPVSALIESEAALRARVGELEGAAAADEAGDLQAAQSVKDAFDVVAAKFTAEPEVPDVEPLPDVEPEPAPEPSPEQPPEQPF